MPHRLAGAHQQDDRKKRRRTEVDDPVRDDPGGHGLDRDVRQRDEQHRLERTDAPGQVRDMTERQRHQVDRDEGRQRRQRLGREQHGEAQGGGHRVRERQNGRLPQPAHVRRPEPDRENADGFRLPADRDQRHGQGQHDQRRDPHQARVHAEGTFCRSGVDAQQHGEAQPDAGEEPRGDEARQRGDLDALQPVGPVYPAAREAAGDEAEAHDLRCDHADEPARERPPPRHVETEPGKRQHVVAGQREVADDAQAQRQRHAGQADRREGVHEIVRRDPGETAAQQGKAGARHEDCPGGPHEDSAIREKRRRGGRGICHCGLCFP